MKVLGDVVPAGLVGALFVLSALTGAYAQDAAHNRAGMLAGGGIAADTHVIPPGHEHQ
jgi:hypothetical protein